VIIMDTLNDYERIRIEMAPFAKPRPRVTQGGQHTYMPKKYERAREDFRKLVMAAGAAHWLNVTGYIELVVVFEFGTPRSWSKKRREATEGHPCLKKPDLDNLLGGVMDALLDKDSKVGYLNGRKVWGEKDQIHIWLRVKEEWQYIPF